MPTAVIAIDGLGGAGKSTLAGQLSEELGGVPIVPTDDFASWDNPVDWWPRVIEQVLRPLATGDVARYRRYDWEARRLSGWVELPHRPPTVILEGVTAGRSEFDAFLSFRIWVEAPRELRLQRGVERDGEAMRDQWISWMLAEDEYVARDDPAARADVIVAGTGADIPIPSG
jgi:uridine kinase